MDLQKYDELRKKIKTKDFEGNNKGLDKWLWRFSFIGNLSSIFFAYFLVYPALLKAITINFVTGNWGMGLAFGLTLIFLVIFEITKRYLIRNFSNDFMLSKRNLNLKILGWFATSTAIIVLSFYLSISGSKNLAQTSSIKNAVVQTETTSKVDSIVNVFNERKSVYLIDNEALRKVNNDLRGKLASTEVNYRTVRNEYQVSIDKNAEIISQNQNEINKLDAELEVEVAKYEARLDATKSQNQSEDAKNILLFVIIVVFNELIIIGGIYFREYFEYTLYVINQARFEKIYQKKDRYKALLTFVYNDGKLTTGDQVIKGMDLKAIVGEKTNIQNPNKFVDEFLRDMDRMGIFVTHGKRRNIQATFNEAIEIIDHYDDAYRILEQIR